MSNILMAVDPGPTPGAAYRLTLTDGRHEYLTATLSSTVELLDWIRSGSRPDHVACESFATGGRVDHNMLYTVEAVGAMKAACHVLGIKLHMQRPTERKSYISNAKEILKQRRPSDHEIDALAHLLLMQDRLTTGEYT